jgi:hypothetical protein
MGGEPVTSDHVVPTVLLGKKQPKQRGYYYAGRIRTHQACNNNFSDESFFKQAIHLTELIRSGRAHGPLQNAQHPGITVLPVTPDQLVKFVSRDFKRFHFLDARGLEVTQLNDPAYYADKLKVNLLQVAIHAAMSVFAKSAAALLMKQRAHEVPRRWRIFSSPYEGMSHADFDKRFGAKLLFNEHTWAAFSQIREDEWLVAYQHKSLLILFLFVFHEFAVDLNDTFNVPGNELNEFSGESLNELITGQWRSTEGGRVAPLAFEVEGASVFVLPNTKRET